MTSPVKVAVFIDRSEAICAGRNKWDWQTTDLDLETLDPRLRETLSRCPEKDGVLLITHAAKFSERNSNPFAVRERHLRDSFELEREGMPSLVDATPSSALQMLEYLASLPSRIRAMGIALLSAAQTQAKIRGAEAMAKAEAHLAAVDRWLSTAPDRLIIAHEGEGHISRRFEWITPPRAPSLKTLQDAQIAYDTEEAQRLLKGERPRLNDIRPGPGQATLSIFDERPAWTQTNFEHLAAAENALIDGTAIRAEPVNTHLLAAAALAHERLRDWHDAQQKQTEAARRLAEANARQALEAHKDAANNRAVREWAANGKKSAILELLDNHAPAQEVTNALRSILFEPLARFEVFRKLKKTDLLVANSNFDDGSGLEAVFDDSEVDFTDPSHQATAQAIRLACYEAEITAQFKFRLHRGRLIRRNETVGVPMVARSILVTAYFGDLKISRAYAIGTLAPIISPVV